MLDSTNKLLVTLIQLTPNSWAYLLVFAKYARLILGKEPSVGLFRSIFTVPIKRDSDLTYASSDVNI